MTTYIDIIRHGEPVGGRRYRGYSIDDPLTEKGWAQMRSAVPKNPLWQHIVSSPLKRCLEFSQELANDLQISCCVEDNFKEIGFGEWEGKTPEEIQAKDSKALNLFYKDPVNNRPKGAEPLDTFSKRVWNTYQSIVENNPHKYVLIVATIKSKKKLTYKACVEDIGLSRIDGKTIYKEGRIVERRTYYKYLYHQHEKTFYIHINLLHFR